MGGGGGEKPVTTQESTVKLSPEQQAVFQKAFPHISAYADAPLEYKGRDIANFDPDELAAHEAYKGTAASTGADLAARAATGQRTLMDPGQMLDVANNPYVVGAGNAIRDTVTKNLMEKVLPGVRSGATMAGGMYSGGNTGEAITTGQAIGDTSGNIANALADLNYRAYSSGLGAMNEAIRNNAGVQAQGLFAPDVYSAVGGQKRAMNQALLDKETTDFYGMKEMPYVRAQQLLGLISGMPGGTTVNKATGALPPGPNALQIAMGGGSLAPVLAKMFGLV
jgi:hypothetical protein